VSDFSHHGHFLAHDGIIGGRGREQGVWGRTAGAKKDKQSEYYVLGNAKRK